MPKSILLLLLFYFYGCKNEKVEVQSLKDQQVYEYIQKYRFSAKAEQTKSGIPISIKLAQGILESKSGRSELARKAKNHFGIKCGKNWKGSSYTILSDEWNRTKNRMIARKGCFRAYTTVDECYSAHSNLLKHKRYKKLFDLDRRDYKNWALGLQKLGYATDPDYAKKIILIIEKYHLYELDRD
jgi:flagellum-specific peptidoglycan hydrolase FlgJ